MKVKELDLVEVGEAGFWPAVKDGQPGEIRAELWYETPTGWRKSPRVVKFNWPGIPGPVAYFFNRCPPASYEAAEAYSGQFAPEHKKFFLSK